tara:strand:- start:229 stop:345 length:117 start_codon:yes stop_codon:yes gene_type:complete
MLNRFFRIKDFNLKTFYTMPENNVFVQISIDLFWGTKM